jgi:YNFM family putative membrane transporter
MILIAIEKWVLSFRKIDVSDIQENLRINRHSPAFWRAAIGVATGGFSIFSLLYCAQPLLPVFAVDFHISPAQSALAISLPSMLTAFSMMISASLSEVIGRRIIMIGALVGASTATILAGFVREWWELLFLRALMGISLGGLPAVTMAYLADEMEPNAIGLAMGLYIGGSGIGGMLGRFVVAALGDWASWRVALELIGLFGLTASIVFAFALPASRNFKPQKPELTALLMGLVRESRDPGLRLLVFESFVMMGSYVMMFNYISFRLMDAPFNLSQMAVGGIFIVYILGSFSSAWMGDLATRYGRRKIFPLGIMIMMSGVICTWFDFLPMIILGLAAITAGFFGAHSVASSWIGLRASPGGRAQASSIYLTCYYAGSAILGWTGGFFWSAGQWPAVSGFALTLLAMALFVAWRLAHIPPPASSQG